MGGVGVRLGRRRIPTQSGLEKAVTATAEAAGASPETAKAIGATVDATAGIALSFGVGATQGVARAASSEVEALNAVTKEATVAGAAAKETQVAAVGEAAGGLPKVVETGAIGEIKTPYQIAKEGGRHSGLLKNYAGKAPEEIRKGIASIWRSRSHCIKIKYRTQINTSRIS